MEFLTKLVLWPVDFPGNQSQVTNWHREGFDICEIWSG